MTMRNTLIAAVFAALLLSASSCYVHIDRNAMSFAGTLSGSGAILTDTRALDDFHSLTIAGFADVHFVQSDADPSVEVETYENILPYVHTDVSRGELTVKVGADSVGSFSVSRLKLILHARSLDEVHIAGSGNFSADRIDCPDDFAVSVAGSGDVWIGYLACQDLDITIAGSGDVTIGGRFAGKASTSIAGSGDVRLSGSAGAAKFVVVGSGDIDARNLTVEGEVEASTHGSGDIRR